MLSKLREWLKRHRYLAVALSAAFIAFEISRAVSAWQWLLPDWQDQFGAVMGRLLSRPPHIVAVTLVAAALFFAIPMALVIFAALKIRRAVSHYRTRVNGPS